MKKFLKKSDKGFSLVELIVVICIMAVLIGVVAPAFLKYVGKSKDSVKTQNKDMLQRAANVILVDDDFKAPTKELIITIKDGTATPSDSTEATEGNFIKLLKESFSNGDGYPNDGHTYEVVVSDGGKSATVYVDGERTAPTPSPTTSTEPQPTK